MSHPAHAVEIEAGKDYRWCACGKSAQQPYCDGSHRGSEFAPVTFTAARSEIVWLCGCKNTGQPPFCDGSHKRSKESA